METPNTHPRRTAVEVHAEILAVEQRKEDLKRYIDGVVDGSVKHPPFFSGPEVTLRYADQTLKQLIVRADKLTDEYVRLIDKEAQAQAKATMSEEQKAANQLAARIKKAEDRLASLKAVAATADQTKV